MHSRNYFIGNKDPNGILLVVPYNSSKIVIIFAKLIKSKFFHYGKTHFMISFNFIPKNLKNCVKNPKQKSLKFLIKQLMLNLNQKKLF